MSAPSDDTIDLSSDLTQREPAGSAPWSGRQRLLLGLLLTASFTLAVDFSILNVALPAIGSEVGFTLANLQWVATSFALCAAGFTLLFGRAADFIGRRRLFLLGMAALGVGSLLGGLAQTPEVLLTARIIQGLATAAVTPAALALLTTSFPEGPQREKALGLNGSLMAAGFTTGAIVGGVLTDVLSWRWAFFINIPVAVAALVLGPILLAAGTRRTDTRLDLPGAATVTAALVALVYGMTRLGQTSVTDPQALGALAIAVVLLVVFWAVERSSKNPLVPLDTLARRNVAWGNVAGVLAFATETSLVFVLTLYLQDIHGLSPLRTGLCFAVLGVGTVIGGMVAPRVIGASSPKAAIVVGMVVQGAVTAPLLLLGEGGWSVWLILVTTFVGGVANLVAIVGFNVSATSGLPDGEQGLATGLANMSTQVGITIGIPVMATVIAAVLPAATSAEAGVTLDAIRAAVGVNAVLCFVAAALTTVFLRLPKPAAVQS